MAPSAYTEPRVEQHEDVGAHEGVAVQIDAGVAGRLGGFAGHQRPRAAVLQDLHGRLGALREGGHLLQDGVFVDFEIRILQAVDIAIVAVGDGEAEHHHVYLHLEHRALRILRLEQGRARCRS